MSPHFETSASFAPMEAANVLASTSSTLTPSSSLLDFLLAALSICEGAIGLAAPMSCGSTHPLLSTGESRLDEEDEDKEDSRANRMADQRRILAGDGDKSPCDVRPCPRRG